jgi:hypothetical protein
MKTRCCPQQLRHPNVAGVQQLVQHRWCGEAGGATSGKSRSKTVNLVNGNARKEIRRKQDGYITKVFCSKEHKCTVKMHIKNVLPNMQVLCACKVKMHSRMHIKDRAKPVFFKSLRARKCMPKMVQKVPATK